MAAETIEATPERRRADSTLTYFTELAAAPMLALFDRPEVIDHLVAQRAGVAMAILDLSDERAGVLRALTARGVRVHAWLVLDEVDGYWLTADNHALARERYRAVRTWIARHELSVAAVGLDIEVPIAEAAALARRPIRELARLILDRRPRGEIDRAAEAYAALVAEIRADGFVVESYHIPLLVDERRARTSFLRRMLGLVDVAVDREILMLYQSHVPAVWGPALVAAYGADADAIGVGSTGGGVEVFEEAIGHRTIGLPDLVDDLRRAARFTDHLYVFSLEGCVWNGFFAKLSSVDLHAPPRRARRVSVARAARATLRGLLRGEPYWDLIGRLRRARPRARKPAP